MKYLKKFNESIIIPSKIESKMNIESFDDLVEYGNKNNFDVVKYDEFYNSLDDIDKKTAPSSLGIPFFALFHPIRKKAMFVICDENCIKFITNFKDIVDDIIGHEEIHSTQNSKRGGLTFSLPNPNIKKLYFSNKDEIMAFSWTIANDLSKKYKTIENAILNIGKLPIWKDILRYCDTAIINRYKKYIYMYLDKIIKK